MPGAPSRSSASVNSRPMSGCDAAASETDRTLTAAPIDAPRLAGAEHGCAERRGTCRSLSNDRARRFPVAIVRRRQLHARVAGVFSTTLHEPIRLRKRQRPEQDEVGDRERGGRRADAERDDEHRGDREARRAAQHARRCSEVLPQQIAVHQRGVADRPRRSSAARAPSAPAARAPAPPAREQRAHLLAVLVAERRGIQAQQRASCYRRVSSSKPSSGAKPAARAILTSCASRRASAFAAAVPSGVIR